MSLYFEAATILANVDNTGGSLKSRLYKQKDLKCSPAQLFALISEASKWSPVLKDVIEKCGLLGEEKKLTPVLALLLTHDLLLAKTGVAANANHVLKLAIQRHKARLSAEFTKSRIRRGFPTLEAFREAVNDGLLEEGQDAAQKANRHPRWVRVNTLVSTLDEQLVTTFNGYQKADGMAQVMAASGSSKLYFADPNIPNLLALPPKIDLIKTPAYTSGKIILQDKASCFPAHLLNVAREEGDVIDGCAAPGNKTTHLAAIISKPESNGSNQKVIAFERDKTRASTLQKMVKLASAQRIVTVKAGADFLAAQPDSDEFSKVGAILLDPSCSGSGIVGRDDAVRMHLPDPSVVPATTTVSKASKKRKRGEDAKDKGKAEKTAPLHLALDESTPEETPMEGKLTERLIALSTFQLRILTHAMRFPAARKITYSTCSIHFEENEGVVARALASPVAKQGGWKLLRRSDQVEGMKNWNRRGMWEDGKVDEKIEQEFGEEQREDICESCIRCEKGTEEGTMGFFVAAFVRDEIPDVHGGVVEQEQGNEDEEDEWNGFSDEENGADEATVAEEEVKDATSKPSKKKRKKGRKA